MGNLLATRRGTLLVATICALAAAVVIMLALSHYRQGVSAANQQDSVLVAKGLIQKGTSGTAIATGRLYAPTTVQAQHLTAGALTDAATLRGQVATKDILPGQQLTAADFGPAAGAATQLAANERAVEIQLDASHGIGGVVQAGDHVDVYGGFNIQNLTGGGVARPVIKLMASNIPVLQASGGASGAGGGNTNVLLELNQNLAPEIAFAADNGKIWLSLRPGNGRNATQQLTTIQTILSGLAPIGDTNPGGKG
jgi:Flp pilus assembly protein CpaB